MSLTFLAYQDEEKYKRHQIYCIKNYGERGAISNYVVFRMRWWAHRKAGDTIGEKTIGRVDYFSQCKTRMGINKEK